MPLRCDKGGLIGTGMAQQGIGAAGMGIIAEKPEKFGQVLFFFVIPETLWIGTAWMKQIGVRPGDFVEIEGNRKKRCLEFMQKALMASSPLICLWIKLYSL